MNQKFGAARSEQQVHNEQQDIFPARTCTCHMHAMAISTSFTVDPCIVAIIMDNSLFLLPI